LSQSFRVVVALLTPFREGGEIDTGALAAHIDLLADAGVDGVMPGGTTGEGPLLSDREVLALTAATIEHARGRLRVIAHVGRAGTGATAALAREALHLGAAGVSAVVPYYYGLTDDQIARHYEALLSTADGADVYAYTIPARAGNELSPAVVRRLAASGLRGVKDSTKSWPRHEEYLACGVEVFIGTDALVVESRRAGSSGCVSALANVRPDLLVRARGGEDVQGEISELRSELPLPRLKRALARRVAGYPTSYRAPLA
jgi:4-hydroxy-tetrahydrodipicolinate synthase